MAAECYKTYTRPACFRRPPFPHSTQMPSQGRGIRPVVIRRLRILCRHDHISRVTTSSFSPKAEHGIQRHIRHRQITVRRSDVSTHCAVTTSAVHARACRFETTLPPRTFFPPCCIISLCRSIVPPRSGRKRNIVAEYTCMRECGRTAGRGNDRVERTDRLADNDAWGEG